MGGAARRILSTQSRHFAPGPKPDAQRTSDGRLMSGVWYNGRRYALKDSSLDRYFSHNEWRRQWIDDRGTPLPRNGFMARKLTRHKIYRDWGKAEQSAAKAETKTESELAELIRRTQEQPGLADLWELTRISQEATALRIKKLFSRPGSQNLLAGGAVEKNSEEPPENRAAAVFR